jgi:hypothetical protein
LVEVLHVVGGPSDFPWTTSPDQLARHLDALVEANVWVATQTAVIEHLRGSVTSLVRQRTDRAG